MNAEPAPAARRGLLAEVAGELAASAPLGLGAFGLASFWMTGHGTLGNPLLAAAVLVVGLGEQAVTLDLVRVIAATALGAAIAAVVGEFLFPRVRDAASALLFSPGRAPLS